MANVPNLVPWCRTGAALVPHLCSTVGGSAARRPLANPGVLIRSNGRALATGTAPAGLCSIHHHPGVLSSIPRASNLPFPLYSTQPCTPPIVPARPFATAQYPPPTRASGGGWLLLSGPSRPLELHLASTTKEPRCQRPRRSAALATRRGTDASSRGTRAAKRREREERARGITSANTRAGGGGGR